MGPSFSRRLVIDADVAAAAGQAEAGVSKMCREFLLEVRQICHRVVISFELFQEWKRHQSRFTIEWLVEMRQRKKVVRLDESSIESSKELPKAISSATPSDSGLEIMLKDLHLIRAALATDERIVSMDERAKQLFGALATTVTVLNRITWVNPSIDTEEPLKWLKTGAKNEKSRRLGAN